MRHVVYILHCSDSTHYVGLTSNLKKRLESHQQGTVKSTCYRRPINIVFYSVFTSRKQAAQFEIYLKTHSGRAFLQKRLIPR